VGDWGGERTGAKKKPLLLRPLWEPSLGPGFEGFYRLPVLILFYFFQMFFEKGRTFKIGRVTSFYTNHRLILILQQNQICVIVTLAVFSSLKNAL
jgi:hypothetical protein